MMKSPGTIAIAAAIIAALLIFGGLLLFILPAGVSLEDRNMAYAEAPKPLCDFDEFSGKEIDKVSVEATGRPYRILPPGSFYTQDYNPKRINLDVNDEGIVTGVWCG